jgi:hypothetical protein
LRFPSREPYIGTARVENDKKKTKNNKETAEAVSTLILAYEFPQTKS